MELSKMPEYSATVLTREERDGMAGALQGLVESQGWDALREVLKRYRIQAREGLETVDMEEIPFIRGIVFGLNLASQAPGLILEQVKEDQERKPERKLQRGRGAAVFSREGEESF